jgi:ubiquinone/menaquinone biosynthesis C-methylase UbiE
MEGLPSPQVERGHYFRGYDSAGRFSSYWHQIDETSALGGRVVEIGIGNGTVAAVLRSRGLEVTTVDVDPALNPDVAADIRALPFADHSFETALAAEVLEHLPWEEVPVAVSELTRVARRGIVVSVPDDAVAFAIQARVPNALQIGRMLIRRRLRVRDALWGLMQSPSWRRSGGQVRKLADVGRIHRDASPLSNQHFWELGLGDVNAEDFVAVFESAGFRLVRNYRAPGYPYHHFFVFERSVAPLD